MKCSTCGQTIPNESRICPFCGSPAGGNAGAAGHQAFAPDVFSGGAADASFGSEMNGDAGFGAVPTKIAKARPGRMKPLLLLLAAVLVVAGGCACYLLLGHRAPAAVTARTGAAAPTGYFKSIGPNRWLITNELLVMGDEMFTQKDLENRLFDLDGSVVGYSPMLRQYQVRFNTDDKRALDQVKASLSADEHILRADYNILFMPYAAESAQGGNGASGAAETANGVQTGLLDAYLPANSLRNGGQTLFLPSVSFANQADLDAYIAGAENIAVSDGLNQQFAEHGLLNAQCLFSGEGGASAGTAALFASAFYIEKNPDASLSLYTTTAAFRYQLARLVESGARVISIPLVCQPSAADAYEAAEYEQMERLFRALEGVAPGFLLCKAETQNVPAGDDYLSRLLTAKDVCRNHTLIVGEAKNETITATDIAGAGVGVCPGVAISDQTDVCVYAGGDTAASVAAVCAAQILSARPDASPEYVRSVMCRCVSVGAYADGEPFVPVVDAAKALAYARQNADLTGAPVNLGGVCVLKVAAEDGLTGQPIPGAKIKMTIDGASTNIDAPQGSLVALVRKGAVRVEASATGFSGMYSEEAVARSKSVSVRLAPRQAASGKLRGRIVDNARADKITSVTVTLEDVQSGSTYAPTEYPLDMTISAYPGTYNILVTAYNRTPVTLYNVTVEAGEEKQLPQIPLSAPSDIGGTVSGKIVYAKTAGALEGVRVSFYKGFNAKKEGTPVGTSVSRSNGMYTATLPGGAYTLFAEKDGYITAKTNVYSVGEQATDNQNCEMNLILGDREISIVLTWGETPGDLDSHLVYPPDNLHVYYDNKQVGNVKLDVDDTSSYGPETTTIASIKNGKYTFYVQDYSNRSSRSSTALARSGAKVTLSYGSREPMDFYVPSQAGTLWEVFSIENGIVSESGRMSYQESPGAIGR